MVRDNSGRADTLITTIVVVDDDIIRNLGQYKFFSTLSLLNREAIVFILKND